MHIGHVALYTEDLQRLRHFYETYFGAVCSEKYENPATGLQTYFLSFAQGPRLEIMTRPKLESPGRAAARLGYIHIAFETGSRENVDVLTKTLEQAGCPLISGPRITGDGYYESVVLDPDGNQVEIVA